MMKLVVKGYKEDIAAFKDLLINNVVCPFINNEDFSCIDGNCIDCIETHIVFKEKKCGKVKTK